MSQTQALPADWLIRKEGCPEVFQHRPGQLLVHHPEGDSQLLPVSIAQTGGSHLVEGPVYTAEEWTGGEEFIEYIGGPLRKHLTASIYTGRNCCIFSEDP